MPSVLRVRSKVEEIEALVFYQLPQAKPAAIVKAVRVHESLVGVGSKGALFTVFMRYEFGRCYASATRAKQLLQACVLLGVLPVTALDRHTAIEALEQKRLERRSLAHEVVLAANTLGFKLTKAQGRVIDEARRTVR